MWTSKNPFIKRQTIIRFLRLGLPQETISNILRVSRTTIHCRMRECDLSVTSLYSSCTDEELDSVVSEIKSTMPNIGYRFVRGASLPEDMEYSGTEFVQLCIVLMASCSLTDVPAWRTYSIPYPKYLVHIDTNHEVCKFHKVM